MTAILMSTYNGERFLREQLDSILGQTETNWQLLVRDDGSGDGTLAILKEYVNAHSDRIALLEDGKRNLGAKASFEQLMLHAPEAEYYMFADQDDVWLPNKVADTKAAMQALESRQGKDKPLVVHTDLRVVDEDLGEMHPSFWRYSNIRPEILDSNVHYLGICNAVTGCAMLFNRTAKEVSLPFADYAFMHDQWIAAKVMCAGGVVKPIDEATILYRQHRKNTVGAVSYRFTLGEWKHKRMLARRAYYAAHPLIWKNPAHFLWWKTKYFFKLHTAR